MKLQSSFYTLLILLFSAIDSTAQITTIGDIPLPEGYKRTEVATNSFGNYLRRIQLKKDKTIYLYDGKKKVNQSVQYAVLNVAIGLKDLQQCADAVMRLRAEYLRFINLPVCFTDNANKKYCWSQYQHIGWQSYLETVYGMCGTLSLEKQLKQIKWSDFKAGDVLIKGGSHGHAVIIIDVAVHQKTDEQIFLLAQSYMPVQDIHILLNKNNYNLSPWYRISFDEIIKTPEWTFKTNQIRTW